MGPADVGVRVSRVLIYLTRLGCRLLFEPRRSEVLKMRWTFLVSYASALRVLNCSTISTASARLALLLNKSDNAKKWESAEMKMVLGEEKQNPWNEY